MLCLVQSACSASGAAFTLFKLYVVLSSADALAGALTKGKLLMEHQFLLDSRSSAVGTSARIREKIVITKALSGFVSKATPRRNLPQRRYKCGLSLRS
jgi:hypothetical protein